MAPGAVAAACERIGRAGAFHVALQHGHGSQLGDVRVAGTIPVVMSCKMNDLFEFIYSWVRKRLPSLSDEHVVDVVALAEGGAINQTHRQIARADHPVNARRYEPEAATVAAVLVLVAPLRNVGIVVQD
jgi:hypothetical protein